MTILSKGALCLQPSRMVERLKEARPNQPSFREDSVEATNELAENNASLLVEALLLNNGAEDAAID
ncbi:hypothetical protein [Bradyrhizobium barranii]